MRFPTLHACGALHLGLLMFIAGCASRSGQNATPITGARDINCANCVMKTHDWDTHRRGTPVHRHAVVMECSDCVVRTTGIWTLLGKSHTCATCPDGVELCSMCRAAG